MRTFDGDYVFSLSLSLVYTYTGTFASPIHRRSFKIGLIGHRM